MLISASLLLLAGAKLSPKHKDWLQLVSPIITKTEKDVFLKLNTGQERDKFISLFWNRRDPMPDTRENEFYQEYMKRVRFSDLNFGHESFKKGSRTERGYFYLLLGPPLERQIYATQSDLWPLELWHYKGEVKYGLPPFFYLVFYQPQGLGKYRLYSPDVEGPEKLAAPTASRGLNRNQAYQAIKKISGELAGASLSYIPGEATLGITSLSSGSVLSGIYSLAEKKFPDAYARHFLDYKDYIEVDYTHDFVDNHARTAIFKNAGQYFIHWTLEPSKLNFSSYQGKNYANFQIIIRIEDSTGKLVQEKEEEIPINITPEEYRKHERQIFAFQDILPIIPGRFKLFFLLKNKTGKEFTSFQANVLIPAEKSGPFFSSFLLYQKRLELGENQRTKLKAFAFNGNQYLINAQNNFLPKKDIGIYFQVHNLKQKQGKSLLIEIIALNTDSTVHSIIKPLSEVMSPDRQGIDINPISLLSFSPGYYRVEVAILDADGREILKGKEHFILLAQAYSVLPWAYAQIHKGFPNPEDLYSLAYQYFRTEKYEQYRDTLEKAQNIKDKPEARLLLAQTLFALQQYAESLRIATTLYKLTRNREAAKVIAANYSALENWSQSLVYLEKLLEEATEVGMLNLAAECYLNLDQPKKAFPLLQKSLKLNPNQPKIKELEEKTKNKIRRQL
jgi:GWxTD domain-containing protein